MTPTNLAAIAGLPVGLFHDPGPTLAAQYGHPPQMGWPTVTYSEILRHIDRVVGADMCFDEEESDNTFSFTSADECRGKFFTDSNGRTHWIPEGYST